MSFPVDPQQMLDEHRRRTTFKTCIDMMRVGAQSGKGIAKRIRAMFRS
ncbi:MAG: hypothetical protein R3A46_04060 [Thermomicrobiales bacterium]